MTILFKTNLDFKFKKDADFLVLGSWVADNLTTAFDLKQKTLPHHWRNKIFFEKDELTLEEIYENYLVLFTDFYEKEYQFFRPISYWRIIIGPFLRFFIDILFERFLTVYETKNLNAVYYKFKKITFDPLLDFSDFFHRSQTSSFNEKIYGQVIDFLNFEVLELNHTIECKIIKRDPSSLKVLFNRLTAKIARDKDVIIGDYLPKSAKLDLLTAGIIPLFSMNHTYSSTGCYSKLARENLCKFILKKGFICQKDIRFKKFSIFLRKIFPEYFPLSYLECLRKNIKFGKKVFPKKSPRIYTSIAYQSDDLFKIWVAESKMHFNSSYSILQHGGNMGLAKINQTEKHQIKSCDNFISWGWYNNGSNQISLKGTKIKKRGKKNKINGERILIILPSFPKYFYCSYSVPFGCDYLNYFAFIKKFINQLITQNNTRNIVLRFDGSGENFGWREKDFLESSMPNLVIDEINDFETSLRKSTLVVTLHNSTTFLESLLINVPTIALLERRYFRFRTEAFQDIVMLEKSRILFFNISKSLKLISKSQDDIENWWKGSSTQEKRRTFLRKYFNTGQSFSEVFDATKVS